ncbi:hypothetical protein MKK75_00970 [Methylobacterium sp. J-030]|uniref:hypothetical protein n=1 Tax=Methylobacterium sp. J-030 TaxID=2836627 RepID=UPI001FBA4584|nr:hypothetical protein [Methylobacterium sp. J-030]MCJ2067387.1 hypothetical protein [Methylobacterium sp. J-030]
MADRQKSLSTTTAVVLTTEQHDLVRRVALTRAMRGDRSRVSVSDVVREAIEAHAVILRQELAQ